MYPRLNEKAKSYRTYTLPSVLIQHTVVKQKYWIVYKKKGSKDADVRQLLLPNAYRIEKGIKSGNDDNVEQNPFQKECHLFAEITIFYDSL